MSVSGKQALYRARETCKKSSRTSRPGTNYSSFHPRKRRKGGGKLFVEGTVELSSFEQLRYGEVVR